MNDHEATTGEPVVHEMPDLDFGSASGAVWGLASTELNANLVMLGAGDEMPSHVNDEVDVLLIVVEGAGTTVIGETRHRLSAGSVVLIPKGLERSLSSASGLGYYSVHRRRPGLRLGGVGDA